MKYIRTTEYDAGVRSGIKCVCGRTIRLVTDVVLVDGNMQSNRTAHLGSECSKSFHTVRVKNLLNEFFEDVEMVVWHPPF